MNHVNFNTNLRSQDMIGDRGNGEGRHFLTQLPAGVLTSPIFVWEIPDDAEVKAFMLAKDEIMTKVREEDNLLPFKMLRVYLHSHETSVKMWVYHHDGVLRGAFQRMEQKWDKEAVFSFQTGKVKGEEMAVSFRMGGEYVEPSKFDADLKYFILLVFYRLLGFIYEVSLPSNFVASVSPDKKGKSVEWTKARTHYVILHKVHPANSKGVKEGTNITRSSESIKRQAHTRRAHARILRSPRFRNKVGLTIYVKATWVGPSEWKEAGSVYRMLSRGKSSS